MKNFQRAYLRSVPRLNVYTVFVYTVVNIQPNSKLHPPPKFSTSTPGLKYARINRKCANKMHHINFDERLQMREKSLIKVCSKAIKRPLHYVKFLNFSGRACSRTPYRAAFSSICFKFALPEKYTLTKDVTI